MVITFVLSCFSCSYVVVVIVSRIIYQRSKATNRMAAQSAWGEDPKYSAAARAAEKRATKKSETLNSSDSASSSSSNSGGGLDGAMESGSSAIEPYKLRSVESSPSSSPPTKSTNGLAAATQSLLNSSSNRPQNSLNSLPHAAATHAPVSVSVPSSSSGSSPHPPAPLPSSSPFNGDDYGAGSSLNSELNDFVEADTSAAIRDRVCVGILCCFVGSVCTNLFA